MMHHPERFKGKVAVVTGAAQGIGRTVAVNLAKEGGQVALVDRSEVVNETQDEIAAAGAESFATLADLEQYSDCCRIMAEANERFGRIDILINNVGGTIWAKPFAYYEEDQIAAEVRRSLFPTLWCCRAVLPFMLEQKGGTIVNVSSIHAEETTPLVASCTVPRMVPSVDWAAAAATTVTTSTTLRASRAAPRTGSQARGVR